MRQRFIVEIEMPEWNQIPSQWIEDHIKEICDIEESKGQKISVREITVRDDVDEAAKEYVKNHDKNSISKTLCAEDFKAGAEWAFGQGVSFDTTVGWFDGKTIMDWPEDITDSFELGDKVIVQIRKK